ncbi:hypothetical protein AYK24_03695 [Thermoplasmatales archaeon SG8-52-4]|nr:MAG: hypothetical protein AYK24_03695 [Thermoplasmatales archaeon SG8-52-4]
MKKLLTVTIVFLFFGLIITSSSGIQIDNKPVTNSNRGNTLYVGGSGPNNYTTIQSAIDDASDGDTVFVYDDSSPYYEYITVTKSINLTGENRDTTIIDGMHIFYVIGVEADWVNISGFTIRNSAEYNAGIVIGGYDYNTITGNNIIPDRGNGIWFLHSNNNTITDNNIISNYYGDGIYLQLSDNHIITNNNISNSQHGIHEYHSIGNTITYNNILNNSKYGIHLNPTSSNNIITGNNISNNDYGIYIDGSTKNIITDNSFFNDGIYVNTNKNVIDNNTVNGKSLVYLEGESDVVIEVDAGQIILINCDNITVQNQEISETDVGIELWNTNNCLISGNTITSNNRYGIIVLNSTLNIITDNDISNNKNGIRLDSSSNNITSNNNIIYHNNFINNTQNAYDECDNIWDDGKYGNYWSNYEEDYPDAKKIISKGIWDTPYEIPGGDNQDNCPLIKPWPKTKSKHNSDSRAVLISPLLRFLERYPLLNLLLQRLTT